MVLVDTSVGVRHRSIKGVQIWRYNKRLNEANDVLGIRYDPVSFR